MNEKPNELLYYIETLMQENFKKVKTLKIGDKGSIILYEHLAGGKKIIKRVSVIRNDEIYRAIRNRKVENLPQIYEVCSDDKGLVVLEEFIEGKSLLEYISDSKTLSKSQAIKFALNICDALEFLHSKGIIHRDIKPSNVIISDNDTAVLIDLSIARHITSNPEGDTQNLGSVGFAAPEQFGISQSGVTTDIYALGVLLNIMLTGVHPAISVAKGRAGRIIKKMISMEINSRYQTIKDVKKALKRA